ncbi:unnamed protein product [Amoebophrya sp. A25]|nr:unnamed protein product [Amoebophrya sp. A25]|eukprot:GSA25T00026401001.1
MDKYLQVEKRLSVQRSLPKATQRVFLLPTDDRQKGRLPKHDSGLSRGAGGALIEVIAETPASDVGDHEGDTDDAHAVDGGLVEEVDQEELLHMNEDNQTTATAPCTPTPSSSLTTSFRSPTCCAVCNNPTPAHRCPKCDVRYCGLACYAKHNPRCTEEFFRDQVEKELRERQKPNPEERRRMEEALRKLQTLDQNFEETVGDVDGAGEVDTGRADESSQRQLACRLRRGQNDHYADVESIRSGLHTDLDELEDSKLSFLEHGTEGLDASHVGESTLLQDPERLRDLVTALENLNSSQGVDVDEVTLLESLGLTESERQQLAQFSAQVVLTEQWTPWWTKMDLEEGISRFVMVDVDGEQEGSSSSTTPASNKTSPASEDHADATDPVRETSSPHELMLTKADCLSLGKELGFTAAVEEVGTAGTQVHQSAAGNNAIQLDVSSTSTPQHTPKMVASPSVGFLLGHLMACYTFEMRKSNGDFSLAAESILTAWNRILRTPHPVTEVDAWLASARNGAATSCSTNMNNYVENKLERDALDDAVTLASSFPLSVTVLSNVLFAALALDVQDRSNFDEPPKKSKTSTDRKILTKILSNADKLLRKNTLVSCFTPAAARRLCWLLRYLLSLLALDDDAASRKLPHFRVLESIRKQIKELPEPDEVADTDWQVARKL